jgi:hypothetical protein
MTASDFETSVEGAQRWLANFRPENISGSWHAAQVVLTAPENALLRSNF